MSYAMTRRKASLNHHGLFRVEGDCIRPHAFSYMELADLHSDYQVDNLAKVDDRLEGKGVRLRKLLEIAGPHYQARFLQVESEDGKFRHTVPLHEVGRTGVIVYQKGGKPLEREDGGPARLIVPFWPDKCANVKGLGKLRILIEEPGDDTQTGPEAKA